MGFPHDLVTVIRELCGVGAFCAGHWGNLREGSRGRTTIFISHRLTSVKWVDRVVMMQNGAIVEQGTHEELLQNKGYYADLYNKQFEQENVKHVFGE